MEFETINYEHIIPHLSAEFPTDYFEYLQSAMDNYDPGLVTTISKPILKHMRGFDYILCPIGDDIRGSILDYKVSWIMSYMDTGAMRGIVYYVNKNAVRTEGPAKELYESFESLFDFEKLSTTSGDVIFLDMPEKYKPIFKKLQIKTIKSRRSMR
jgi:hypothetical protein